MYLSVWSKDRSITKSLYKVIIQKHTYWPVSSHLCLSVRRYNACSYLSNMDRYWVTRHAVDFLLVLKTETWMHTQWLPLEKLLFMYLPVSVVTAAACPFSRIVKQWINIPHNLFSQVVARSILLCLMAACVPLFTTQAASLHGVKCM